jgi:hypothetical protein
MGDHVLDQIRNLRNLEAGWDSYDAAPVSDEAMKLALHCVYEARSFGLGYPEPIVGPTADGGVELIWQRPGREEEVHAIFSPSGARYIVIGSDRGVAVQGPIDPPSFAREVLKPRLK